jgi:hypothetical protein
MGIGGEAERTVIGGPCSPMGRRLGIEHEPFSCARNSVAQSGLPLARVDDTDPKRQSASAARPQLAGRRWSHTNGGDG